jgi:hypothetical protein
MRTRVAKIADKLARSRLASVIKFASKFGIKLPKIASTPRQEERKQQNIETVKRYFAEQMNLFIKGLKDFVQEKKIPEAEALLDSQLNPQVVDQSVIDDFKKFINTKAPALLTVEGEEDVIQWRDKAEGFENNGVSQNAIKAGDKLASWVALLQGRFDKDIKSYAVELLNKHAKDELYGRTELVDAIFDRPNMAMAENTGFAGKKDHAKPFIKGMRKFFKYPAMTTYRDKEEEAKAKEEYKSYGVDVSDISPIELIKSEEEYEKEFKDYLQQNVSRFTQKGSLKGQDLTAVFVLEKILEAGGLLKKGGINNFPIKSFLEQERENLDEEFNFFDTRDEDGQEQEGISDDTAWKRMEQIINVIKGLAVEFVKRNISRMNLTPDQKAQLESK